MPATQAISATTPAGFARTLGRRGRRALVLACAPCVLTALMAASPAAAQSVLNNNYGQAVFGEQRNIGVRDRPRPDYDALGIRSGAFLLFPKVTVEGAYDDNIYAVDTNKVGSGIVSGAAEVNAISNWSRHKLGAVAKIGRSEYTDQTSESNTTYGVGANGQLDVQRDFNFTGLARYDHQIESRTASGTPLSAQKPIEYNATQFDFGASKVFNRLRIKPAFSYRNIDFDDYETNSGVKVSQAFRHEKDYNTALQVDYAVSPDTSVFVQASGDWQRFDAPLTAANPIDRNSGGYQLNVGADFDLTQLARGHIQAGYLKHDYDDSRLPGISSIGLNGSIEYYPTQLLTVTFTGSRAVGATGLTTTAGYLATDGGVQADYELLRNLILTGKAAFGHDSYQGIDRTDKRFIGSVGATYLVNRSIGLNLLYTRQDQSSNGVAKGPEFGINRFSVALTLQR